MSPDMPEPILKIKKKFFELILCEKRLYKATLLYLKLFYFRVINRKENDLNSKSISS